MKIGIPTETHPDERRVAATPRTAKNLCKLGFEVTIESGAGEAADFPDPLYAEAGVRIVSDTRDLWHDADLILKVRPPGTNHELGMYEADLMHHGATLISFLWPAQNGPLVALLASRKITVNDLERALTEHLENATASVPVTNPIGCNVKWDGKDAHWMPEEACDLV